MASSRWRAAPRAAFGRLALAAALAAFPALGRAAQVSQAGPDKWPSAIPDVASKGSDWTDLFAALSERKMSYGTLAAARAALHFFSDAQVKEAAYRAIVKVVDLGYPFSTRADFVPGDLDPSGRDPFTQSYLLYKGIVNLDKKMQKWADHYFEKIDREAFSKYLFFSATEAYRAGEFVAAVDLLKKAIAQTSGDEYASLAAKEARTLARIYFEAGQSEKSLDIYQSFLLRLNPVAPTDWLEAAWNLYRLKRFPEALGMLYNLESRAAAGSSAIEKYVLRALIYREYCSEAATDALIKDFDDEFGSLIDAIKLGEPLRKLKQLAKIDDPESLEFRQIATAVEELESEFARVSEVPDELRPLATYLYTAELASLRRLRRLHEDRALESMAKRLTIMNESLRFLKFEVARERFSPDRVFAPPPPPEPDALLDSPEPNAFRLRWKQWGDYWRDERLLMRGMMASQCDL
jgi:tetratricopeptide (TPR) repeat protein